MKFTALAELCWEIFVCVTAPGQVVEFPSVGVAVLDVLTSFIETGKVTCREFLMRNRVTVVLARKLRIVRLGE